MNIVPRLVECPERKIVGIGNIGEAANPGDCWPVLLKRIEEVNDRVNQLETIGLIKRDELGYMAGVEINLVGEIPEGMYAFTIPAGQYAAAVHRGPISRINDTFEALMSWLGSNHYEQFDVVCFEVYDDRYKGEENDSEFDVFVQIKSAVRESIVIDLVEVAPFKALAVRTGMTPDKSGTRVAWNKLTAQIPLEDARLSEGSSAYVFIPQEQWSKEVETLWVGLAVREFGDVPDGIDTLEVSGGLCVSARVSGDEAHMWRVYDAMFGWLEQSSEYEIDTREGVLGMETVPLEPLNALTIPYSEIETFAFTMLYPIRKKAVG
ncbi:GyrI-like domain-containing protein [Paenibacillus sp. OV219]|uniref:GyrI-like domain-containing protein n=1 Tax=Paenibacillus sp. OV219 TaxID=1884377 RepID=UPI0008D30F2E|nr:GyrI-like domain-containing protein [Paenibacillus sp. OV219]SEN97579.1 Predicted transcriptional regulator YdeE, contains AraC-type DNA-binding domain [Paenibacillus sp. OV219]